MLDLLPDALRSFAVEQAGRLLMADRPGPGIRELRTRFGLTQKQVADLVDLRRESLSRIEGGRQSPSADLLRALVRTFTLVHGAREHVAEAEADDRPVDPAYLHRLAKALGVPPADADGILMQALSDVGGKREKILEELGEETG